MEVDLRALKAFLTVVEAGGFTAAARAQGISQPALSRTIKQLEAALDVRLFDRDTRNLALTEIGRELQVTATRLISDFDDSLGRISDLSRGELGTVVVASVPTLAAALVPPAIASFLKTREGVTVHVQDAFAEPSIQAVLNGSADLALTVRPPDHTELKYHHLFSDRFVAVGSRNSGLERWQRVDWSILATRPFIAFHRGTSVRMLTDAALAEAGIRIKPRYECGELATVGGMLAAGLGITALPELALSHLPGRRVHACPLDSPVMTRALGIVTSSRRSLSPSAREFMTHLIRESEAVAASVSSNAELRG